jgi:acetyl/propionyl-CoA carboxylase alpha subunit
VSPEFDPLLSKLCVWAPTREIALARLRRALSEYTVLGVATNLAFLERLLSHPRVLAGDYDTTFVEAHAAELTEPLESDEQRLRDALVLTALAAHADRKTGPSPHQNGQAVASSSRWRDAPPRQLTRYR